MTTDMIRKLSALCKRWDELDKERDDIEAQIEKLIADTAAQPVEPVSNEIQIGDLVEVVSCTWANTRDGDIGTGGVVSEIGGDFLKLKRHPAYSKLPDASIVNPNDCRKVAAHARPGVGTP